MLGVSIFTGIYYWIMKTDVGYGFTHAMRQPLFSALFIGLIMGDFTRAIVIGAAIQILYIGLVAAGSNSGRLPGRINCHSNCYCFASQSGCRCDNCRSCRRLRCFLRSIQKDDQHRFCSYGRSIC